MNPRFPTPLFALALSLTGGLGLSPSPGFAQEAIQNYNSPVSPANEGFQKNERSTQGSDVLGDGFNPLNLIHNANFRRSRNGEDFAEDTQTNLNKAAADFKRQQQLRLQQQQTAPVAGGDSSKP
jgi:hypothetical protein